MVILGVNRSQQINVSIFFESIFSFSALEEKKKIFDELDREFDLFRKAQRNSVNFGRFSYADTRYNKM